jgi:hypothetical protein
LEGYVRVIVVSSCHADGNVDLVVEEVGWGNGPLRGHWRTVGEGGDSHGEAVPVLSFVNIFSIFFLLHPSHIKKFANEEGRNEP